VLRRPLESAQYVSIKYTERLAEAGVEPLRIPVKPSNNSNASRSPIPIDAEQYGSSAALGAIF
jgi:hypothetical protein